MIKRILKKTKKTKLSPETCKRIKSELQAEKKNIIGYKKALELMQQNLIKLEKAYHQKQKRYERCEK